MTAGLGARARGAGRCGGSAGGRAAGGLEREQDGQFGSRRVRLTMGRVVDEC